VAIPPDFPEGANITGELIQQALSGAIRQFAGGNRPL
jgi:hypothetical protein